MRDLTIQNISILELKPYEKNPRNITKAVDKVAESIKEFGFNVPIITDEKKNIVAGHTRYAAAKKLGLEVVPVIILDDLTEDQIKQYRIIDNKTGELSSWDYEKLIFELDSITEVDMDAFELGGFDDVPEPKEMTNLDDGEEINLDDFGDDKFEIECPYCGFKWNE